MHRAQIGLTVLIALVAVCETVPAADLPVPRRAAPPSIHRRLPPPPPETPQQLFEDFLRWLERQ
jgi:hypothetical protein